MRENNYAFIDSQNVNLGIRALGWQLDFRKFRTYLEDKYSVTKAYLFIGYIPQNERMYTALRSFGYVLVFKPTLKNERGIIKGNCDGELILQAMIDYPNYEKAVIVTGDGDFYCLARYLWQYHKLSKILIPDKDRYSSLLKDFSIPENNMLDFMNSLKNKLEYLSNEKGSRRDETLREPFSS
jgi:uncharacterized LabA/DUF88 family protein